MLQVLALVCASHQWATTCVEHQTESEIVRQGGEASRWRAICELNVHVVAAHRHEQSMQCTTPLCLQDLVWTCNDQRFERVVTLQHVMCCRGVDATHSGRFKQALPVATFMQHQRTPCASCSSRYTLASIRTFSHDQRMQKHECQMVAANSLSSPLLPCANSVG